MLVKGIIDEDFVNYKKPAMVIEFPCCDFKCDKECGKAICQNSSLVSEPDIEINAHEIIYRFFKNDISEVIVFQGLEPLDSFSDVLKLLAILRLPAFAVFQIEIIIYTGYTKEELQNKIYKDGKTYLEKLQKYPNIIIKYGRYIPGQKPHYDEVLGVNLASDNQYAERLKNEI